MEFPEYAHVYRNKIIDRQTGNQTDGKTDIHVRHKTQKLRKEKMLREV